MVERQSGTLSKSKKDEEVVEDIAATSLEAPPTDYEVALAQAASEVPMPKVVTPTADQLAADAHIPIDPPLAILGDEQIGEIQDAFVEAGKAIRDEEVGPDLDTEDWMSKLNEDEIFNSDKGPAPRLHGLRRLARPFIYQENSLVNALTVVQKEYVRKLVTRNGSGDIMSETEVLGTYNLPMASVTFTVVLLDGRIFSDSADAYFLNCEELGLYPTAVASARAEARCLRKVLGIREHAAEEIVDKDAAEELTPDDDSPIKPEQSKLIEKILKGLEISLADLLESITTREIFTVSDLTTGEARIAIRQLHDLKRKHKKKVKKS